MTPLWDFGWFDLSRFEIEGSSLESWPSTSIIGHFMRDPVSQRSFCDSGGWGEPVRRHGPFLCDKFLVEWLQPITHDEFAKRLRATLDDPDFTATPSSEQRKPVDAWVDAIQLQGDEVFALDPPGEQKVRVGWHFVWLVYREFFAVSANRRSLAIGVIGYD